MASTLTTERSPERDEVRINAPVQFDFSVHRDFRRSYDDGQQPARQYVVDLRHTQYMDSAALGMLLQLREHVGHDTRRLHLVNASKQVREILQVAAFDRLMTIT